MKMFSFLILTLALLAPSLAQAAPVYNSAFEKVIYISAAANATQSAANTGRDYTNPKGWFDGTLFTMPAGCTLEQMYAIVDVVQSGLTLVRVGDSNDAAGIVSSASSPLAYTGVNWAQLTSKGAYLKQDGTAGAKYFSADTAIALDVTGTATAGKARFVFKGFCL